MNQNKEHSNLIVELKQAVSHWKQAHKELLEQYNAMLPDKDQATKTAQGAVKLFKMGLEVQELRENHARLSVQLTESSDRIRKRDTRLLALRDDNEDLKAQVVKLTRTQTTTVSNVTYQGDTVPSTQLHALESLANERLQHIHAHRAEIAKLKQDALGGKGESLAVKRVTEERDKLKRLYETYRRDYESLGASSSIRIRDLVDKWRGCLDMLEPQEEELTQATNKIARQALLLSELHAKVAKLGMSPGDKAAFFERKRES